MQKTSTIELFKERMKFSVAHFTIFSATERENLHGHNYNVYAAFTFAVKEELSFDYRHFKDILQNICAQIDETTLLAGRSKYLHIEEDANYYHVHFADEEMLFLKRDATILPLNNITVEELSNWLLEQLLAHTSIQASNLMKIRVKVFSGPGQSGSASWRKGHG